MDIEAPRRLALIDGNSFYCSCERVMRPDLQGRPLVVLSNNDGCAIARTAEAKQLGIKMGAPWFKIRSLAESSGLVGLSANFDLYGDLSARMMSVIGQFSPQQEVYSIDECFLDLTGDQGSGREIGTAIRDRVLQWVGIPTCVGIGPTKTLAKLANHLAKIMPKLLGVCDLSGLRDEALLRAIRHVPVGEVWGVGQRLAPALQALGILTAADLAAANLRVLQGRFSIVLARTAKELRGEPAIEWEDAPAPKRQIMCSRSFGAPVSAKHHLANALAAFASRAAEKLRAQDSVTQAIQIFIRTSPFRQGRQYSGSVVAQLLHPTASTPLLLEAVARALDGLYRPGLDFAKAGVCLLDITPAASIGTQGELFEKDGSAGGAVKSSRLLHTVDTLNARFGRDTVSLAGAARQAGAPWQMRQQRKTPAYTTDWNQIVEVWR